MNQNKTEREAAIRALPKVTLKIGKETRTGHLDKEAGRFYPLDSSDAIMTLDGIAVRPTKKEPPAPPAPANDVEANEDERVDDRDDEEENDEGNDEGNDEERDEEPENKRDSWVKRNKKAIGAIAVALFVIIAVVTSLPALGRQSSPQPGPSADTSINASADPDIDNAAEDEPTEVSVIMLKNSLQPGEIFVPADAEEVVMPIETFKQAAMFNNNYCLWSKLEYLTGYYAAEFLPAGHIIMLDDIRSSTPIAVNPWGNVPEGYTKITVAINEQQVSAADLNWGNLLDLTIRKVTTSTVVVGEQTSGGTSVSENSVTEEFVMPDLAICDILDTNGDSLYYRFAQYIDMPLSERYDYIVAQMENDDTLAATLKPSAVVVVVKTEAIAPIGNLNGEGITMQVKLKNSVDASTDAKSAFNADARTISWHIENAQLYIAEKRAAEEAARQQAAEEALAALEEQQQQQQEGPENVG